MTTLPRLGDLQTIIGKEQGLIGSLITNTKTYLNFDIFKYQASAPVLPQEKQKPVEITVNSSNALSTQSAAQITPIDYRALNILPIQGIVTGGTQEGQLLPGVNPRERLVGFKVIKNPVNAEQTWVIIHGWNSTADEKLIGELTKAISDNAGPNDRILALDWREAAGNGSLADAGNGKAATWIASVAEWATQALQQQFGIDANAAQNSLNLVGHSLGSLVSAEMGRIYRDGFQGQTLIAGNGNGVKTITALDPPSELNLGISGGQYDLDARKAGKQIPLPFSQVSVFSRAFNGALSVGGNAGFAVTADEAFQMDFGNVVDNVFNIDNSEHIRVVRSFTNLVAQPKLFGDLLSLKPYQLINELPINNFDILKNRLVGNSGYRGVISVDAFDRSNLLIAQARTGSNDDIVIGGEGNDLLSGLENFSFPSFTEISDSRYSGAGNDKLIGEGGNDRIFGKADNDLLSGGAGNDELYGDLVKDIFPSPGQDLLYGGTGRDLLTGGQKADTFVFKVGDGGYTLGDTDTIVDFEIGIDRIGLINIAFEQLSFQQVNQIDSLISFGSESLALLPNVSVNLLQNREFFIAVEESIFQVV